LKGILERTTLEQHRNNTGTTQEQHYYNTTETVKGHRVKGARGQRGDGEMMVADL
jgi:hypothetical protein